MATKKVGLKAVVKLKKGYLYNEHVRIVKAKKTTAKKTTAKKTTAKKARKR